jgi:hypothetical protein
MVNKQAEHNVEFFPHILGSTVDLFFLRTETFINQTRTELHEVSVTSLPGASFSTNSWMHADTRRDA